MRGNHSAGLWPEQGFQPVTTKPPPSGGGGDHWVRCWKSNFGEVELPQRKRLKTPRRSARVTHLCSLRLTHSKNTIWRSAKEAAIDIIHAEGVRVDLSSSAPQARNVFSFRESSRLCRREAQMHRRDGLGSHGFAAGQENGLVSASKAPPTQRGGGHFWRAK